MGGVERNPPRRLTTLIGTLPRLFFAPALRLRACCVLASLALVGWGRERATGGTQWKRARPVSRETMPGL
jgi:hypothetical protein